MYLYILYNIIVTYVKKKKVIDDYRIKINNAGDIFFIIRYIN